MPGKKILIASGIARLGAPFTSFAQFPQPLPALMFDVILFPLGTRESGACPQARKALMTAIKHSLVETRGFLTHDFEDVEASIAADAGQYAACECPRKPLRKLR